MADIKAKRKAIENKITVLMNAFDPTGANTEYYKSLFAKMDDKAFSEWMNKLDGEENFLILQICDYERNLLMQNVEDAAKTIGVPLYERLALPFLSSDPNTPVFSKYPVPVGYLPLKRMQQSRIKKNSTSIEIAERNKFNQVTGHDKNGRSSDQENNALLALGSKVIIKEFLSARADDSVMKNEMHQKISKNGYVTLNSLTDDIENKTVVNLIDVYLISMGLKSDLITKNLMVRKTIKDM